MKVTIANRIIGEGAPCFIIAEAGVNHNGDLTLAKKLIDAAKEAKADAVKFQTFTTEEVVTETAEKAEYQKETTGSEESQFEMVKKLELSEKDFTELFDYAQKRGILCLSTPFDEASVDLLDALGVAAFKVGSGEITNFPLLKYIANKKKPVILSTGMATLEEVEEALIVLKKGIPGTILLHCVSNYPARIEDTNLKVMETLRQKLELPVGLSDHTPGITVPIAAVAMGACVIEKHFTLDRKLPGPDHRASLEPEELREMVTAIRDVEKAMGDGIKKPTADEEVTKKVARRSITANVDIDAGTIITKEMLGTKRPGTGIEPKYIDSILSKKAKRDIRQNATISWDDIEEVQD